MKTSYLKDILRTIRENSKRFIALLSITALGITVYICICAACDNMYIAADQFYEQQHLFDIRVLSTLGLTDDDVTALARTDGISAAEGSYRETVYTMVAEQRQSAEVMTLSKTGINQPFVSEGRLPQQRGEIAVTQKYLDTAGKKLGDTLEIEEEMNETEAPETEAETESESADDEFEFDEAAEIEEDPEKPNFLTTTYQITGVVISPMDISNKEGTTAFRSSAATDYTYFVTPEDVSSDIYTDIYLTVTDSGSQGSYSDSYQQRIRTVTRQIEENVMVPRQQARYDDIQVEARTKIQDAEKLMNEKFAEADQKLVDARQEITDAGQELAEGESELNEKESEAVQKIADARSEIESNQQKINDSINELNQGEQELADNEQKIIDGKQELTEKRREAEQEFAKAAKLLEQQQAELDQSRAALLPGIDALQSSFGEAWPESQWQAYVSKITAETAAHLAQNPEAEPDPAAIAAAAGAEQVQLSAALGEILAAVPGSDPETVIGQCLQAGTGLGIIEGSQQVLSSQQKAFQEQQAAAETQMDQAAAELADGEAQLEAGRQKLENGWQELIQGQAELDQGAATLEQEEATATAEIAKARTELEDGKSELADGRQEYQENNQKYLTKKTEAKQQISDAYDEVAELEMAQWYVQDRSALDSYSGLDNDLASINVIGQAFPVLFLIVAVLISLTTMTRMVEEERGIIGTYKALGFSEFAIATKYLCYALIASLAGGLIGNIMGFYVMPRLLQIVLEEMYIIPGSTLRFNAWRGLGGVLLFAISIVGATALACKNELRQTPAGLMRPKAPRAGSRIILERFTPLWKRLRFLNKVTARNLFRYKKRLLMTVFGIAGCTALVLVGFAIRDSIMGLIPKQYETVYRYDVMVAAEADGTEELTDFIKNDPAIADYQQVQLDSGKIFNTADASESVQIIVVSDGERFKAYIENRDQHDIIRSVDDQGIFLTANAAELLGLGVGDQTELQDLKLNRHSVKISAVVDNYMGNSVYISQHLYQQLYGEYEANGAYLHLKDDISDQAAYAESLLDQEFVMTSVSVAALIDSFSTDFKILNAVIYGLIVFAAGLAFVVLFTLSNTNISERNRELATIKVLGFFDREVHSYVNKETLILTLFGVVAGLPLGYLLSGLLLAALKMPSIQFELEIQPLSYLIAGVISFCFALVVNLMTNRTLNKIDMVEALKSVE